MLLCTHQLVQVHVPPLYIFQGKLQLLQQQVGWRLLAGSEELAGVFRVIRHEQVEKGGEGLCLNLMDVESVWFDGRYGVTAIVN